MAAVAGARQGRELRHEIGRELHRLRVDAGLSVRTVARAAGISHSTLTDLELGIHDPTVEALSWVGSALGCQVGVRLRPGSGPAIHDHIQTAMLGGILPQIGVAWQRFLEVPVFRPIRGYIDLALERSPDPQAVAMESLSGLERVEQMLRWMHAKSDALQTRLEAQGRPTPVSRVLLLRTTESTRRAVVLAEELPSAEFPARMVDALAALRDGSRPWPGAAIIWMSVSGGTARVRPYPPPGIRVGR